VHEAEIHSVRAWDRDVVDELAVSCKKEDSILEPTKSKFDAYIYRKYLPHPRC
jgi:hypothetical protein